MNVNRLIRIKDNNKEISIPYWYIKICCHDNYNGEMRLLDSIISNTEKKCHIFDVGATGSTFPNHVNNNDVHLFDPEFIESHAEHECTLYRHDVNYKRDSVHVNKYALGPDENNSIKKYCDENNITEIEFLKIDTDGYDMEILKGCKNINLKYLQFEYDINYIKNECNVNDIFNHLKDWYFFYIKPEGLIEITKNNPFKHDYVYCNIFASKEYPKNIIKSFKPIIEDGIMKTDDVTKTLLGIFWELKTPPQFPEELNTLNEIDINHIIPSIRQYYGNMSFNTLKKYFI